MAKEYKNIFLPRLHFNFLLKTFDLLNKIQIHIILFYFHTNKLSLAFDLSPQINQEQCVSREFFPTYGSSSVKAQGLTKILLLKNSIENNSLLFSCVSLLVLSSVMSFLLLDTRVND